MTLNKTQSSQQNYQISMQSVKTIALTQWYWEESHFNETMRCKMEKMPYTFRSYKIKNKSPQHHALILLTKSTVTVCSTFHENFKKFIRILSLFQKLLILPKICKLPDKMS